MKRVPLNLSILLAEIPPTEKVHGMRANHTRKYRFFWLCAVVLFAWWLAKPGLAADSPLAGYHLEAGDTIQITVENEPDLTLESPISEGGSFSFPLLGEVKAVGLTARELEEELRKKLLDGYLLHPMVAVMVLTYPSFHVHGEVKKSGSYPFQPGMTVNKAVSAAEGFAPFADRNRITITRRQNAGWELITSVGMEDPILPKDILHVPITTTTTTTPQETEESTEFAYRIGAGDKIKITVDNEPNLSVDVKVSAQGGINLPMLGEIHVANLTVKEAEETLRKKLAEGFLVDPIVFVTVAEYRVYYMHGEIKKAGGYPFQPGLTIRKAIALAEGFTEYADKKGILVVHDDDPLFKEQTVGLNDPVLPGDVIHITASFW